MKKDIQKKYIALLTEFVAFKTVSTDLSFKSEIKKAVAWLTKLLKANGFKVTIIQGKKVNPVIIAKYIVNKNAKTVLVYGHYDVQPASKTDGWISDPFTLTKKKDKYIARGVVDNKGQILAHMVGVFDAIAKNALTTNVTFIIEGNEESGNDELAGVLKKYKKELANDFIIISDGEMVGLHPTLDASFRGGGNMKVVYQTADNDRHSGLFGGAIPNAVFELATLVSKLKQNNVVAFSDFYKGMMPISKEIKNQHEQLSLLRPMEVLAGVKMLVTEPNTSSYEQVGLRPTIEFSGFTGGYAGAGFKNIVPGRAEVRINVRTVHPQNSSAVLKSLEVFIKKETPAHIQLSIDTECHGDPIALDVFHHDLQDVKELLSHVHGKELLHRAVGGGIPVVGDFQKIFKSPMAMIGLCNDDCNMHGVHENFSVYHMDKALEFVDRYWKNIR